MMMNKKSAHSILFVLLSLAKFHTNDAFVVSNNGNLILPCESLSSSLMMSNVDGECNHDDNLLGFSRRQIMSRFSASVFASAFVTQFQAPAIASGGATAGGAYLLSAKQRYNKRVIAGIKSFLALSAGLESGDLSAVNSFFATEEEGGWKDASAAGYLLANAFRTSSTKPPDSLPSVKKWKAFASATEAFEKTLKKKDMSKTKDAYNKAAELLEDYLGAVELPPGIEISQS